MKPGKPAKKLFTTHFLMRVLPLLTIVPLIVLDLVLGSPGMRMQRLCCYMLAVIAMALCHPQSHESLGFSKYFIFSAVTFFILSVAPCAMGKVPVGVLFLLPSVLMVNLYGAARIYMKYRDLSWLFRRDGVWCRLEEDSRAVYSSVVAPVAIVLMLMEDAAPGWGWYLPLVLLETVWYVRIYRREYTGKPMLLGASRERKVRDMVNKEMDGSCVNDGVDDELLAGIFRKVQTHMQLHRPYLEEGFSLDGICSAVRLNRVYVSKAINKFAKKNVRQYINHYRVLYSVEVMKRDPAIKIIELAFGSGFHSVVTFNMAFKMFMNVTPSDMLARIRLSSPHPVFSIQGAGTGADPLG